jgi:hypothetical protein
MLQEKDSGKVGIICKNPSNDCCGTYYGIVQIGTLEVQQTLKKIAEKNRVKVEQKKTTGVIHKIFYPIGKNVSFHTTANMFCVT